MTELELWQERLLATLHDPVHKALVLGTGLKHTDLAARLARSVAGRELRSWHHAPDRLASGADRPVLGGGETLRVDWRSDPVITHPLQPGVRMRVPPDGLPVGKGAQARASELTEHLAECWERWFTAEEDHDDPPEARWKDLAELRRAQLTLWRRLPEWSREAGVPLPWLPADSRCPDHPLASHLRVAAAAAFVDRMGRKGRRPERQPWMLVVSVRGVQDYIAASRKTRDLWTACMVYAELVWAAMHSIVNRYGPEAILYPDLRENPLMDQWLLENGYEDAVPDRVREAGAGTFAAPIPNTFVALVPRGGAGDLPKLEELAAGCEEAVHRRWGELAASVERFVEARMGSRGWKEIWRRQLDPRHAPTVTWVAARWRRRMLGLGAPPPDLASLPGRVEDPDRLPEPLQERTRALSPWIPDRVWRHYESARQVYWCTDALGETDYLSAERGFDYPLVHHQLYRALEARKQSDPPARLREPGEKCSVTGVHEALSARPTGEGRDLRGAREAAREFWSKPRLDAEGTGEERLGGPATMKRYLPKADDAAFLSRWNGWGQKAPAEADRTAPFPSAAALAMGGFLVRLGRAWDGSPALRAAAGEVLARARAVDPSGSKLFTMHPLALPRLRALREGRPDLDAFYRLEPQTLHADALEVQLERPGGDKAGWEALLAAVRELLKVARVARQDPADDRSAVGRPQTRLAVLKLDGDSMSRLVLGDPDVIQARWRDVLHPKAVDQIEAWRDDPSKAATGWPGFLDQKRAMGPSLHAAITTALATFTHRVAGWVVEREFGGRLVYAGGDDVLALLPASEAIPCAARLQQLVSAPFLVDTRPATAPWAWRVQSSSDLPSHDGAPERRRFLVPAVGPDGLLDPAMLSFEPHAAETEAPESRGLDARADLHLMLGRAHGLSASAVIAHYKTPLQRLLTEARRSLDKVAKRRQARDGTTAKSAIAVTRFSRGGSKYTFCAGWELGRPNGAAHGPPEVQRCVGTLQRAFAEGRLPARLPYKLREKMAGLSPLLYPPFEPIPAREAEDPYVVRRAVLERLVKAETEGAPAELRGAVVALLEAGLDQAGRLPPREREQAAVAGLLLARDLADRGGED